MKLSRSEKYRLYNSQPLSKRKKVCDIVGSGSMSGAGWKSIFSKISNVLGHPIVKQIGEPILKEIVMPFFKKKLAGKGINLPGAGLNLAGKKRRTVLVKGIVLKRPQK